MVTTVKEAILDEIQDLRMTGQCAYLVDQGEEDPAWSDPIGNGRYSAEFVGGVRMRLPDQEVRFLEIAAVTRELAAEGRLFLSGENPIAVSPFAPVS